MIKQVSVVYILPAINILFLINFFQDNFIRLNYFRLNKSKRDNFTFQCVEINKGGYLFSICAIDLIRNFAVKFN